MAYSQSLFTNARFGLEYEALIRVINEELWGNFDLANDHKALKNPPDNTILKAVIDHLNDRAPCPPFYTFKARSKPALVKRNILCHQFNSKVSTIKTTSPNNKLWFRVADGYRKEVCKGPPVPLVTPPTLSTHLDTKYTWVVTHDSSVVEEDEDEDEQLLENMEMVSPPLKIIDSWDNIKFMISSVFNNTDWISRLNIKTSNHVHFTLCDTPDGTDPIWITYPEVLYNMCRAWWHFEPVFMMLCEQTRRSNRFCASMHRSIYERYEEEAFGTNGDPSDFLQKIFKGADGHKMNDTLSELTPPQSQFKKQLEAAWYDDEDFFNADQINDENANLYKLMRIIYFFQGHPRDHDTRYASLNLLNTITNVKTIESRLYEGSKDPKEVMSWINLIVLFFSRYQEILTTISLEPTYVYMQNICWGLNEFMYYLDWSDLEDVITINDRDTEGINSLKNIVKAFNFMMSCMGVSSDSEFYKYWKHILEGNIKLVYITAPLSEWFNAAVIDVISPLHHVITKLLNAPFTNSGRSGGGKKKDAHTHIFLYGLESVKDLANSLGIKTIKKSLTPKMATLPKYKLTETVGHIAMTKHEKSSIKGTVVTLTKEQLAMFKDIKLTTRKVIMDSDGQIIRCKVIARTAKSPSQDLTKEQEKKVKSILNQNKRYSA